MQSIDKKYINQLLDGLHKDHINPQTDLKHWTNPTQFMVCTILSAQATDEGVNKVTPKLFEKCKTPQDFLDMSIEELTKAVSSINFYKTKAQRIHKACQYIVDNHSGKMPKTMDELVKIPGIGRKSANVIMTEALGLSAGIVVDTHMTRVTYRWKLQPYDHQKNAVKIEQELMKIIPKEEWKFFSSATVLHGRYVCKAKKPKCTTCTLNTTCKSAFQFEKYE